MQLSVVCYLGQELVMIYDARFKGNLGENPALNTLSLPNKMLHNFLLKSTVRALHAITPRPVT